MGLVVELQGISDTLHEQMKLCDKADPRQDRVLFSRFETPIYRASIPHLGQLANSEVHAVFKAYEVLVTQEQETLAMLSKPKTGETYIIHGPNIPQYRKEMIDIVLPEIGKALEELRKNQNFLS